MLSVSIEVQNLKNFHRKVSNRFAFTEELVRLGLFSLETRQLREERIEVYKIISGINKTSSKRTKGHQINIANSKVNKRSDLFIQCVFKLRRSFSSFTKYIRHKPGFKGS